ncbi:MAG: EamA family transporter, partial [Bacillota bacterium]
VPFAIPSQPPTAVVTASVLALSLLSTALAYLLFFYLILQAGPTKAVMVTYLAPAFGVLWGALLLKEPLGVASFAGFGLLLASIAVVNGAPARPAPLKA